MKSKTLSIVLLGSLFILGGCGEGAREYFNRAGKYARSEAPEDWERAIAEYQKVIGLKVEAYNKTAYLHRRLADLFLKREMFRKAEEHYLAAIELLPNIPDLHYSLGITYANLGKTEEEYLDKAILEYEKAVRLKPDFAKPYYGMGFIYFFKKGMHEEGISNMKKAIEYDSDYIDAYVTLGRMYYEVGNYRGAISEYEGAISKYPKKAKVVATYYSNIGLSYLALGENERAAESFEQALKINRQHPEARAHLKEMGIELKDRWEKRE